MKQSPYSGMSRQSRASAAVLMAVSASLVTSAALAGSAERTIYGEDSRREVFSLSGGRAKAADATLALVSTFRLRDTGQGSTRLSGPTLAQSEGLCPGERFAAQPTVAFCSGALVAPQVALTAGHCLAAEDLPGTRFVFGFRMRNATQANLVIPNGEIYRGTRILARSANIGGADYTLVQLDRKVVGHAPLRVERAGPPPVKSALYVLGHPDGLPEKLATGEVYARTKTIFRSNLDVFNGNSGSPVFDARNNRIVGVTSFGNPDYVLRKDCAVPLRLPDSFAPEGATSSAVFAPFVPQH